MEAPDQDRRHGEDHRFLLEGWPSLLRPLMEVSQYLRQHAREIAGKSQLFINSYAKAIEVIPRQLCDNAEFDATDFLNKLRQKHASGANFGVDINTGGITDSFANFVWEPAVVKINAINAATEATCLILSVNETEKIPKIGMVTKYVCWGCEGWLDLQLVEKQLKMGDINRIPASSAFYMVNTGQRLHIICSIDTTSDYTMDWLAPPYQYSSLAVESLPNPCSPGST